MQTNQTTMAPSAAVSRLVVGEQEDLKREFVQCLRHSQSRIVALRQVTIRLIHLGVPVDDLHRWAETAGGDRTLARKLLSQVLLELGIRRRKPGAGPGITPEAMALISYAQGHFGERAPKVVRAACRVLQALARRLRWEAPVRGPAPQSAISNREKRLLANGHGGSKAEGRPLTGTANSIKLAP